MRNKKKDIILDFTSLLDIVLLLLFFFILFSKIGADTKVKDAEEEAQKSQKKYEVMAADAEKLQDQLKQNLAIVDQVTSQEADEILNYNSGNNLKLLMLDTGDSADPLLLKAVLNKKIIGECIVTDRDDEQADQINDVSAEKILSWFEAAGLTTDSVILCDFVYDGDVPRTSEAYTKLTDILESIRVKHGYSHFYISSTDLSIGGDD